jgi:hypothetical protein
VAGSLPPADVALVSRWIELNRQTIIDFWNDTIGIHEVAAQLQKLDP